MRLLLVEDDAELAAGVRADLVKAGFAVDTCDNGIDAEHLGDTEPYDVVVLDLGLPAKPGIDVLRAWRQRDNRVPVIVLTARDAWYERVDGFRDEDLQQIRLADGSMRELTGTEFRLLRYMMLNAGRILSKSMLSDHVYDQDSDRDSNLIEVYVRRLREKIGASMILTKRGQGYIFIDGSRQP